jgi:hypothetical protein
MGSSMQSYDRCQYLQMGVVLLYTYPKPVGSADENGILMVDTKDQAVLLPGRPVFSFLP